MTGDEFLSRLEILLAETDLAPDEFLRQLELLLSYSMDDDIVSTIGLSKANLSG